MQKLFIFMCLFAVAFSAEVYYAPTTYYASAAAPAVYAARSAVLPLAYARLHAPVETYNSVQTPDSFQQQYRSDYKPLTYEYVY